jgi:hypothetical protein
MTPISTDDTASPGTATNAPRATVERTLGDDLLRGADAIAEFLFGDRRERRKIYYLTSEGRGQLPHFRLGAIICARKSTLVRWVETREAQTADSSDA